MISKACRLPIPGKIIEKDTGERKEYFRVRWQFPDAHLDKEGKPFKYKSPSGSGTPIYIPEKLRRMYKEKEQIPRLYIQEGEKKQRRHANTEFPQLLFLAFKI